MKLLINLLFFVINLTVQHVSAQEQGITVSVTNATSDKGKVNFALYTKKGFLKEPLQRKSATIKRGISTIVFDKIEQGEYAVVCYHDKNNNDIMDFEPNGMPTENYGASNNTMNFGPPKYNDAKFMLNDKNVSLEIRF
ncbi:conserved exported hypothetical protein [Tenacibaculum sp. 190524A02b]|uniref:DUF2141 domain-containing protein n=1 Tax=Tenacibaculum vairaonense TaxID=3137860 RepID=A0ABM9PNM3_9FLAO